MSPPATHPLGPRLLATGVATLLLSFAAPAAGQTPDPGQSEVNAAPTSVPADGVTASTITVTVRDAGGTPLPGQTVVVSSNLGTPPSPNPATDVGDGTYTATITSLDWGTATITATVNGNLIPDDATVEFTASALQFDVQPSETEVNATISPPVRVEAVDGNGVRVTSFEETVNIAIQDDPSGGTATLSGATSDIANNGLAQFNGLSINEIGNNYSLQATSTGLASGESAQFNITPAEASGTTSTIDAAPTSIVANGSSTSTITVQLKDAGGNNLTSGGDTVNLFTSAGSLTANPATDNGNGTYTATLTSSTTPGTATITGTVNGNNITDNAQVTFTVGPASGALSTIDAAPTSIVANGSSTSTITVQLKDAGGNNLTSGGDTVNLFTSAGSLTANPATDNGNGTYTATLTSSTTPATATITGTVNANNINDNAQVTFTVGPASGALSTITAAPTSIVANGSSTSTITVQLKDAGGNNLTSGGDTVNLFTSAGSLTANPATDNGNGTYTATLTSSTTPATATITGTVNGNNINDNAQVDFTAGSASGVTSTITATPTSIVANGSSTSTITVQLKDANGNNLTTGGDTVNLFTSAGSLTANPATDNGNGTYTATLTSSTTAGTATITGTVNGNNINDNATVTFLPGDADELQFVQQPTTTPSSVIIAPAITVRTVDANGNTNTSFNDNVTLTIGTNPGGGTLSGTTTVAAVSGVATFANLSIDLAGVDYTLIAQASGLGGDESSAFNIVPGPPSGATSLITANPTAITADGASTSTITVELLDANGNPLTLGGDNVALSTNHGSLGGVLDNGDGTYTAILTASTLPQTATITGTVNATPITDTATVAFVIGSADRLEIVQQPSTTAVGALFVPRVSVRVVDANGNTVPSFTGPISVAIGNNPGGGSLIGTTTVNAVGGTATFPNLAISQAGSGYTLVFSGAGFTPVTSIPFTVTAGGASGATSTITANPTSIPADGASTSTITVQLKDGGGSNETNGGDLVTLSTTAGTLSSVTDNNDGTYTATLTSSTTAGTATITGTVNGGPIASSAAVTFSAGSADLAITAAVNNPNPTLGSTIVYTITVTNSGPDTATGVQVTDALPSRLSLVSAEASQGTFTVATGVWNVGELEPGASATLALTANVGP